LFQDKYLPEVEHSLGATAPHGQAFDPQAFTNPFIIPGKVQDTQWSSALAYTPAPSLGGSRQDLKSGGRAATNQTSGPRTLTGRRAGFISTTNRQTATVAQSQQHSLFEFNGPLSALDSSDKKSSSVTSVEDLMSGFKALGLAERSAT